MLAVKLSVKIAYRGFKAHRSQWKSSEWQGSTRRLNLVIPKDNISFSIGARVSTN
jgi:hypothetical protein